MYLCLGANAGSLEAPRGIRFPGSGVIDNYEPCSGIENQNSNPPQEHKMFFTADPFF